MRVFDAYPTIFLTIIVAVLAAIYLQFSQISLTGLGFQDLGTKFLTLIFIALVIERAVEIYIKNRFADDRVEENRSLRVARATLRSYQDALAAANAAVLPVGETEAETTAAIEAKYANINRLHDKLEDARTQYLAAKIKAEPTLQALSAKTKRAATIASLALSLCIAVVGIRILTQFLPPDADSVTQLAQVSYQLQSFQAIDIVLTTLLLSGGADGMHQLIKEFLGGRDELLTAS